MLGGAPESLADEGAHDNTEILPVSHETGGTLHSLPAHTMEKPRDQKTHTSHASIQLVAGGSHGSSKSSSELVQTSVLKVHAHFMPANKQLHYGTFTVFFMVQKASSSCKSSLGRLLVSLSSVWLLLLSSEDLLVFLASPVSSRVLGDIL